MQWICEEAAILFAQWSPWYSRLVLCKWVVPSGYSRSSNTCLACGISDVAFRPREASFWKQPSFYEWTRSTCTGFFTLRCELSRYIYYNSSLTNSMVLNSVALNVSWSRNSFSIHMQFTNSSACVHKSPPLCSVMLNTEVSFTAYFCKINFNIILLSTSKFSQVVFPLIFTDQNCIP